VDGVLGVAVGCYVVVCMFLVVARVLWMVLLGFCGWLL